MRLLHTGTVPRLIEPVVRAGTLARMRQPVIPVDDHLVLRPWEEADAPAVVEAFAEPEIQQWHARSMDASEAVAWIGSWSSTWSAETDACWAIARASDESVVGRIALRHLFLAAGSAEIGYWVLPHGRRQGAASRATVALSGWAFEELGLHRLDLLHSVHNQPSCDVAVRAGFVLEGTLRSSSLHRDGWHDMHIHGLVNEAGA